MKITLEELQKLFKSKEQELDKQEFDLFVNKFWETKEEEKKAKIKFNKIKLENIKESINLIDTKMTILKLEKQRLRDRQKEIRQNSKELKETLK